MSGLKMISYAGDFRAMKGLIAARFNGVAVETDESFEAGKTDKTKEFLKVSPLGKVPVLSTPKGHLLGSNAIARYLARHRNDTELLGSSFFEQAQVDSWVDWVQTEIEVPTTMLYFPIFGFTKYNPKQVAQAKKETKKALRVLEEHLKTRSFMVGRKVTLADIVLVSALLYPFKMIFDARQRRGFPSVTRWFMTCVAMPEFFDVVGQVNLCAKEMPMPKQKKEGKKKNNKKEGAKKKSEKKAKKAKKPRKPKHPLDALPKSTLNLDTWKKTYSNSKKDYYKSMDWLWPNFDKEGYSIWTCKYKYNEENKVDWLCSNKINGYIQRLDEVRKYSFGVMAVLDTKAKKDCYEVVGAWLMRGQEIKYLLNAHEEGETFEWTKLDDPTDEQKKFIADLWCGMKLADGTDIFDSCVFK